MLGQKFLRGVYETLRSNRDSWRHTLMIITYDEHGGLYDHVIPPIADLRSRSDGQILDRPSGGGSPFIPRTLLTPYGVRVPTFVVSPWVPAGKGPDIVLDHCSIVKTILACFCGDSRPFLSDRIESSRSFNAFLTETTPRINVPVPKKIAVSSSAAPKRAGAIITPPLFRKQMRAGNVDFHDLTGMLARLLGRNRPARAAAGAGNS
jgi:phospholipase C